ncbi:hypothetical protein DES43_107148 [Aquamicrobium defluvii]|uniref:Uncharacterized protein n=1 Tax=Aquamicrobium defluvii TaxID=69279 RepID=A0A4R6YH57_9HYPH|nr:hypothetical protein DES43_107148 [Aquamicrobium defluvii]
MSAPAFAGASLRCRPRRRDRLLTRCPANGFAACLESRRPPASPVPVPGSSSRSHVKTRSMPPVNFDGAHGSMLRRAFLPGWRGAPLFFPPPLPFCRQAWERFPGCRRGWLREAAEKARPIGRSRKGRFFCLRYGKGASRTASGGSARAGLALPERACGYAVPSLKSANPLNPRVFCRKPPVAGRLTAGNRKRLIRLQKG